MFCRKVRILFILAGVFLWLEASPWAMPLEPLVPRKDLPNGWTLIHGPQIYNRKTLFEHINGQAELYLKYGFQGSVFAIYQNRRNEKDQIELDIYDMGNVLQAFGIFSRFRNEDRPAGIGLDSYLDDHSALFYKGKYFVLLYAVETNPNLLKTFSKRVSLKILDPSPPPKEISYFPKNGLKPGSIQYFSEGLLGQQFLKKGFQGIYTAKTEDKAEGKDKEFKLFLAIYKDSQEAINALRAYKENLSKKGSLSSGGTLEFKALTVRGEDPYLGKIFVLQKKVYLLGMVGFEKEDECENILKEFIEKVR